MKSKLEKMGVFSALCMSITYINTVQAKAAENLNLAANTGDENKMKIFIGITVLCLITALVTLKRILNEKKPK